MTWRRQPPVLSPVSLRAIFDGVGAVVGFRESAHQAVSTALCKRYSCLDALLTDSGTSALILALQKIVRPGGTVAYPAYGCIDLTTAALGAGVRVRFYDVDPRTLSPDLDSVRSVIGRGVDAIVVAHLFGYPADMIGVAKVAAEEGIPVIEDAAQGVGGALCGAPLGGIGDVSILSFGRGKGTTAGAGGALLVRSPELAALISRERSAIPRGSRGAIEVLMLAAQRVLSHPYLYRLPSSIPALKLGEMVYRAPRLPHAMSSGASAVLRWTLQDEPLRVSSRRECARKLLANVRQASHVTPVRPVTGGESGFLRFALLDTRGDLAPCVEFGCLRGYPMTVAQHPELASLIVPGEIAGKGSVFLRDRLFTVPTHKHVRPRDFAGLTEWLARRESQPGALVAAT